MADRVLRELIAVARFGFLVGVGVLVLIMGFFGVVIGPGFIVGVMYGEGWGLLVGLPWGFGCVVALSVVIVAAEEGTFASGRFD